MYRILVASPSGFYKDCPVDPCGEAAEFFTTDRATCTISMDPDIVENYDGVVIPGGLPDVDPSIYGEENTASDPVEPEMDRQQLAMIDRAYKLHKPMIGFCRGLQLAAVYFGGTLIQCLDCKDQHGYEPGNPRFHKIYNVKGTFMHDLYGDSLLGNSGHHQALKKLPEDFRISQFWCENDETAAKYMKLVEANQLREGSSECVIEAVYHKDYPFVGIQWHPEMHGELYCGHLDLSKIINYFYRMMEQSKQ